MLAFALTGASYSVPVFAQELKPIPLSDPLSTDSKLNIVGSIDILDKTIYAYTTEIVPQEQNEIIFERKENTKVYDLGNGQKEYKIYAGVPQFYFDGNLWYQVEYGETATTFFNEIQPIKPLGYFSDLIATAIAQTTYYPSMDGYVGHDVDPNGISWASLTSASGNWSNTSASDYGILIMADDVSNQWNTLSRIITLFDTSAITDGDTVTNATAYYWGGSTKADSAGWTPNINIYSSTPASDTTLANTDYAQIGSTALSTAITYANWSTSGYNSFVLNDMSVISKTGKTKLGLRNANYDVANSAPTWSSSGLARLYIYFSEQTGTNNDPYLSVTTTSGGGGGGTATSTDATSTPEEIMAISQFSFMTFFIFFVTLTSTVWIWTRFI